MQITLNMILDQLGHLRLETHVPASATAQFVRAALLPRDYGVMRPELLHVCQLSQALQAARVTDGMYYICIRDRIRDEEETEELLRGITIVNKNMDIQLLLDIVQDVFLRLQEWHSAMQEVLIQNGTLQELVTLSEGVIGNTINISDSAFMRMARTTNLPPKDVISQEMEELGYHTQQTLGLFRKYNRYAVWQNETGVFVNPEKNIIPFVMVNRILRHQQVYSAHIVMVCDYRPFNDGILELFQVFTDMVYVFFKRAWAAHGSLCHGYDAFLMELLNGDFSHPAVLEERASYLGIHCAGEMQLMVVKLEDNMDAALGRVGQELEDRIPHAQVLLYERSVVALLHPGLLPPGSMTTLLTRVREYLDTSGGIGGLSNPFTRLQELPHALEQAQLAVKYCRNLRGRTQLNALMPLPPLPPLGAFQDRVLHGLLGENPGNEALWRDSIYYRALQTLYYYDLRHETNSLQLLRLYLWHERKATDVGAAMGVHRNNIVYRIRGIEKLIAMDLGVHHVRVGLEMSFLMMELYGLEPPAEDG